MWLDFATVFDMLFVEKKNNDKKIKEKILPIYPNFWACHPKHIFLYFFCGLTCVEENHLPFILKRVKINGKYSLGGIFSFGFPSGAILVPLLLHIFISDLFLFTNDSNIVSYTNDNIADAKSLKWVIRSNFRWSTNFKSHMINLCKKAS